MAGISNETIVNFFEKETNDDLKKKFVGVFPLNYVTRFISLFNSFGFEGFKEFVIDNDRNILNKILFGIEKFQKKDNKITLITLKFSMNEYEKIKNGHRLRPTTQDLLHLMYEFGKLHKIKDIVKVHLVNDQL